MWFFVAVLILWATTATMARWDPWVLAPIVQWFWWTLNLYVCAAAALSDRFTTLESKLLGLFGYCLVAVYFTTMGETYLEFLPSSTDNPDLWPSIFLSVNLIGPMVLITVGCLGPAVQSRR